MERQAQELFQSYILERVKEEHAEDAKALLEENFKKQDEGQFTQEDIARSISMIMSYLRPEKVVEVQAVMKRFADNYRND